MVCYVLYTSLLNHASIFGIHPGATIHVDTDSWLTHCIYGIINKLLVNTLSLHVRFIVELCKATCRPVLTLVHLVVVGRRHLA